MNGACYLEAEHTREGNQVILLLVRLERVYKKLAD
jgi:hypothetical protein